MHRVVTKAQLSSIPMGNNGLGNPPMTIQMNSLTELLKIFPGDATVCGFEEGLTMKNADGSGEVVLLNDSFQVPNASETNRSDPIPSDSVTPQNAPATNCRTHKHKLWIVPRKSV